MVATVLRDMVAKVARVVGKSRSPNLRYSQRTKKRKEIPVVSNIRISSFNLLTTTIVAPPSNASKWQMGFNSVFNLLAPEFGI